MKKSLSEKQSIP